MSVRMDSESGGECVAGHPRAICRVLYSDAQNWWFTSLGCRLGAFLVGAGSILIPSMKEAAPYAVASLSAGSTLLLWLSDEIKGRAETLKRKEEGQDLYGDEWKISPEEIANFLARSPAKIRKPIRLTESDKRYFASNEPPGAKRAFQNVKESSWFSGHVAAKMGQICLCLAIFLICGSFIALITALRNVSDITVRSTVGEVITSLLLLVFSLNLLSLIRKYFAFSQRCSDIEKTIVGHLKTTPNDLVISIKMLHEYQLARASTPLLPSRLFLWMRPDLNELWEKYHAESD